MLPLELKNVKDFQMKLIDYIRAEHQEIITQIENGGVLDEELNKAIIDAAKTFRDEYMAKEG